MPRFKTSDVADAETERCSFADLSLPAPLLKSLAEMGCEHPSPVQMRTIPAALDGGDVIVQAKSGTGKTIAFCSVVLQGIDAGYPATQALILAPTREIALQVTDELQRLGWYFTPSVSVACFIGGLPIEEDEARLGKGAPHVVVGTPGRILKLLREKSLAPELRFMVLDEADKLLDCNFRPDITAITEKVFTESLQFLAVSATFPPPLIQAAEDLFVLVEKRKLKQGEPLTRELPKRVFLCTSAIKKGEDGQALVLGEDEEEGTVESAVLKGVLHFRYVVEGYHVRQKFPALLEILSTVAYQQAFVFCPDTDGAVQIAEMLSQAGIPAAASSGRMDQNWRTEAFAGLKRFHYRVLVCTDLLARGVDCEKVDVVVNLGLPQEKETYLHRSGRTARFGSIGLSISVVFEGEESSHLSYFQLQLGFELADYAEREAVLAQHMARLGQAAEASEALLRPAETPFVPAVVPNGVLPKKKKKAPAAARQAPHAAQAPAAAQEAPQAALECLEDLALKAKVQVTDDAAALLEACREANIGEEHDGLRLSCLGKVGQVVRKDSSDGTVKVSLPLIGKAWFPLKALQPVAGAQTEEVPAPTKSAKGKGGGGPKPKAKNWTEGEVDDADLPEWLLKGPVLPQEAAAPAAPAAPDIAGQWQQLLAAQQSASPAAAATAAPDLAGQWQQLLAAQQAAATPAVPDPASQWQQLLAAQAAAAPAGPDLASQWQQLLAAQQAAAVAAPPVDILGQYQQLLAAQQGLPAAPAAWGLPAAQPSLGTAALQAALLGLQAPAAQLRPPSLPAGPLPPPIFRPPGAAARPPPEVQALLPEWEPWMLACSGFAQYSALGQLGSQSATAQQLEALWAHHRAVWASLN